MEITFFVSTIKLNLLHLQISSDRLVIVANELLKQVRLAYANKTKKLINSDIVIDKREIY